MRGVRFLEIGFIQNVEFTRKFSVYDTATPRVGRFSTLQDGNVYVDCNIDPPPSTVPWADSGKAAAFLKPVGDIPYFNQSMSDSDRPKQKATDRMIWNLGAQNVPVSRMELQLDFGLYFAVRTTEASNGSEGIYTQRAAGSWRFDGSGSVTLAGVWNLTGTGNTGDTSFAIVNNGARVPVTTGPNANELIGDNEIFYGWVMP